VASRAALVSLERKDSTQLLTYTPAGLDRRWFGSVGHVNQLKYSYATPGGCDKLSFNLMLEPTARTQIMNPGRIVEAYRGGGKIWEGILQEPVPTAQGWNVSAIGAGQYGANFVAAYTDMWPTNQPDQPVSDAITRGLRWSNPGLGAQMWQGAYGSATSPGGGHVLASTTIPAGTWDVTWLVGFTSSTAGSAAAADNNNFGLYLGGTLVASSVVDAVDNGVELYVQSPVQVTTGSSATLSIKTLGSGSSGMVYYGCLPPGGCWLGQEVDPAAQTITDLMNLCCTYGALTWYVNTTQYANTPYLFPIPFTPDRLLVCTDPVARTLGGDINTVFERYEVSTDSVTSSGTSDVAVYGTTSSIDQPSATAYGASEVYLDMSQAGVMPAGAARAVGSNLLQRFLRASFAGPFTVGPGQLMTMGGQPVDLGSETSLHVYQLILTDYGYGGEVTLAPPITFLGGGFEYDDDKVAATVTPFQYLPSSMTELLSAAATVLPSAFTDS
jgi:hypothetical protein